MTSIIHDAFSVQRQDNLLNQARQQINDLQACYRQREEAMRQAYSQTAYRIDPNWVQDLKNQLSLAQCDRDRFRQRVIELEKTIECLKGGRMARKDFFDSDGDCNEHGESNCETCLESWHDAENRKNSKAIIVATSALVNGNEGLPDLEMAQITAQRTLTRQLRFIKKSLGFSDEQLKKKKIKEIPTLIQKAEEAMTIGGMVELLTDDIKDAGGVIKSVLRFFFTRHH